MNPRHETILQILASRGEVTVNELSERFGVSSMTIRRDFEQLESENRLNRTHGGAVCSRRAVVEFEFLERAQVNLLQKQAIACEVAQLIEPRSTIVIDTGTTTLESSRLLGGIGQLTVLTTSLAIAGVLYTLDNIDLMLLGGNVRKNNPDLTGSLTEENLKQFRPQMAILGADAVNREGLFTRDMSIASISRIMIEKSERTMLIVDSSKFNRTSFIKFSSWQQIDILVTDDGLKKSDRKWIEKVVGEVHVVSA